MRKKRSCAFALESDPHTIAPKGARIVVAGAGTIGCFVGGMLASAGHEVTLLARPRIAQEIRAHGLTLTDYNGMAQKVDADGLNCSAKPECLANADVIFVTVRSGDTEIMARTIAAHAAPNARIISLQGDTENTDALRAVLAGRDLRVGMVAFNVNPMGQGCFHRVTPGDIMIEKTDDPLVEGLCVPGLSMIERENITGLQWGAFLVNLNSALNALSGMTVSEQLSSPAWRKLLADQWAEAVKVLKANRIRPVVNFSVPLWAIPLILRLPTPLFMRVARSALAMDAQARSPMSHDLLARRETEVRALQGRVVRLGSTAGLSTPISAMVVDVIRLAETADEGLPNLPVSALRREI